MNYFEEKQSAQSLFNNKASIEEQREAGREAIALAQDAIRRDRERRKQLGADKDHEQKCDEARALVKDHAPLTDTVATGWSNLGVLRRKKE